MATTYDTIPSNFTVQPNVDASNNNNAATDIEGGERFFLSEMDISISADKLQIPGGDDTQPFDADCWANLKIPVSHARNLFQYQTDAVDVDDLNTSDVKFRMYHLSSGLGDLSGNPIIYYNAKNIIPSQAITYFNSIQYYGSIDATTNNTKVDADYCRYIGKETFGIANTDIFNNELDVRLDITKKSAQQYVAKIQELVNFRVNGDYVLWNDSNTLDSSVNRIADNFPTKLIYKQMLNNVRSRFSNINGTNKSLVHLYEANGMAINLPALAASGSNTLYNYGNLWRKLPFVSGDKLFFNMTINPNTEQKNLSSGSLIVPRSYRIRLDIVEDNEIPKNTYIDTYTLASSITKFTINDYFTGTYSLSGSSIAINEDETRMVLPTDGHNTTESGLLGQVFLYKRTTKTDPWSSPIDISGPVGGGLRSGKRWSTAAMDETGYRLIVTGYSTPLHLFLWNSSTQTYDYTSDIAKPPSASSDFFAIRITNDGSRVVFGGNNGYVFFSTWNGTGYTMLTQTPDTIMRYMTTSMAMSNDGSIIAYGDYKGLVSGFVYAKWNGTNYGNHVVITALNGVENTGGWFSPDGNVLFVFTSGGIKYSIFNSVSNNFVTFQTLPFDGPLLAGTLLHNRIGTKVFVVRDTTGYTNIGVVNLSYTLSPVLVKDPSYIPEADKYIHAWDYDGYNTITVNEPDYLLPQLGEANL